ncbi:MAG: hypothetical protein VB104_13160, partial [Candidatus Limiplasma sp.]|nr:hypothetical protein [Candidatus Limiplasma sp.]
NTGQRLLLCDDSCKGVEPRSLFRRNESPPKVFTLWKPDKGFQPLTLLFCPIKIIDYPSRQRSQGKIIPTGLQSDLHFASLSALYKSKPPVAPVAQTVDKPLKDARMQPAEKDSDARSQTG